jgi:hypothetical protein
MGRRGFHVVVGVTIHGRPALTGTIQLDRSCLLDLLRNHFPPNSIVPAWNRRNRAGDVIPEASRCWKPRISRCLDGRHELAAQMARGQHTGHRVPDVVPWVPEKASDASQQRSGASEQRLGASEQNSWASDSMSGAFGKASDASRQRSGASGQRSGAPEQNSWASDSMSGASGKASDASRQSSDTSDRGSAAAFEVTKQGDRSSGSICFRKSFVLRSLQASDWPAPRSLLGLRKHRLRHDLPPNRIAPAQL